MRSSPLSNRHKNNLSREGISPATQSAIPGSHFGRATGNLQNQRRNPQTPEISTSYNFSEPVTPRRRTNQSNSLTRPTITQISTLSNAGLYGICQPKTEWASLGDGWVQVTSSNSGILSRAGLHNVVESVSDGTFICIFDGGAFDNNLNSAKALMLDCITKEHPKFNISIEMKAVRPNILPESTPESFNQSHCRFMITFSTNLTPIEGNLMSIRGTYICGDTTTKTWVLGQFSSNTPDGSISTLIQSPDTVWKVLRQVSDEANLKPNIFCHMLIQIRDDQVSLDVNDNAIFTSISIPSCASASSDDDDVGHGGLVGLVAMQSKFVFKNFELVPIVDIRRMTKMNSNMNNNRMGPGFASPVAKRSPKKAAVSLSSFLSSSSSDQDNEKKMKKKSNNITATNATSYQDEVEASLKSVYVPPTPDLSSCVEEVERYVIERIGFRSTSTFNNTTSTTTTSYKFSEIAALDIPKQILIESVCMPLLLPQIFTGIRSPWKGILLFGSPGTGKSMLARAIVNEVNTLDLEHEINSPSPQVTFFNCTVSSILSKFRGESEKMIKIIFEMAAFYAPSIIFLDEVDAVLCSRGSDGEHEASRRIKSEILTQIDGVCSSGLNIFIIATSNSPWDLDNAILRRLEKRIYIPLPDYEARVSLFSLHLTSSADVTDDELNQLAHATDGFSCADILSLCREASMLPLRRLLEGKSQSQIESMNLTSDSLPLVSFDDLSEAISRVKPSVSTDSVSRLNAWNSKFGTNFK